MPPFISTVPKIGPMKNHTSVFVEPGDDIELESDDSPFTYRHVLYVRGGDSGPFRLFMNDDELAKLKETVLNHEA